MARLHVPEALKAWLPHIAFVLLAIGASAPAWIVKYPPVQDLPYHVATIRILHSFHNDAFGLQPFFDLHLTNTHYLLYYVAGSLLAYPLTVAYASVVLMSAYFAGTVLAMASLLRSLGRDPRASILAIPLLSNVLFVYGLLPFLLGIPLMFWGLGLAMRHCQQPRWSTGVGLAVVSLACFYSHIVPFGLLGMGWLAMLSWRPFKQWLKAAAPGVPALILLIWWLLATDAGRTTGGLLSMQQSAGVRRLDSSFNDVFAWFTNMFQDNSDELCVIAAAVVALLSLIVSVGKAQPIAPRAYRYGIVPLACLVFYFVLPVGHDFIWPLAQRFVILFALTLVPLWPFPTGTWAHVTTVLALIVAAATTINTSHQFVRFQQEEVGDFDEAAEAIPAAKKVCALIFNRGSRITNHQPFLHFGSWIQAQKGGVIMFTFAGYPHWPVDFKSGMYPPPGGPARRRWEWTPERVTSKELYPYYDYILTRGSGFHPASQQFEQVYQGSMWHVWKRVEQQ